MRKMLSLVSLLLLLPLVYFTKKKDPQTTKLTQESHDGPFREASKDKMQSETESS